MKNFIMMIALTLSTIMSYGQEDNFTILLSGGGPISFIGIEVNIVGTDVSMGNTSGGDGITDNTFYADPNVCTIIEVFIDPNVNSVITDQRIMVVSIGGPVIINELITGTATYIFRNYGQAAECQDCNDPEACNYDNFSTLNSGCGYALEGFDCDGNCLSGVTLNIEITADTYTSENSWTLKEDGVEIAFGDGDFQSLSFCVDPLLCYEFTMVDLYGDGQDGDDGLGGFDGTTTITLDGVEVFTSTGNWGTSISGNFGGCVTDCGDDTANNYNADADIIDNDLCTYDIAQGCTDAAACNYDADAVVDDSSCTYTVEGFDCDGNCLSGVAVVYTAGEYPGENLFTITNCESDTLAIMLEGEASFNGCVVLPENYTIYLGDTYGDTWNGGTLTVDTVVYDQPTSAEPLNNLAFDIYEIGDPCIIQGCTDSSAINYNSLASEDDGSCLYEGCTDLTADNYDVNANTDDGSCIYCSFNDLDLVTLVLTDSYGDGWNGNNVSINSDLYSIFDVNGEFTTDVETPYEGGFLQTTNLCVDLSECIEVNYNNTGLYGAENSWEVYDSEGNVLAESAGYVVEVDGVLTGFLPESGTIGDCDVVGIEESSKLEDRGSFKVFNTMGQEIPLDRLPSNIILIRIYENGSSEKFLLED